MAEYRVGIELSYYFWIDDQSQYIKKIIDRDWYEEYICSILSSLRECRVEDNAIILVVNKISSRLNKLNDSHLSTVIYQLLLLTDESRCILQKELS